MTQIGGEDGVGGGGGVGRRQGGQVQIRDTGPRGCGGGKVGGVGGGEVTEGHRGRHEGRRA